MKTDTEFEEIGRKLPYKVPLDFFEKVSKKTLQEAKHREQKHRKIVITMRTFAVAASIAVIALLGHFMSTSEKPESKQIVQEKQTEVKQVIRQTEVTDQPVTSAEKKKVVPVKTITKEIKPEAITDVLAELSDDELLQLASICKSDPFIEESRQ